MSAGEAKKYTDRINTERVKTTKERVAHAIRLIENPVWCMADGRIISAAENDIAHAVNLLEAGEEEMRWACAHFDWNDEICDQINDACSKLGCCLAHMPEKTGENPRKDRAEYADPATISYFGRDALAELGKALATLVRWFDDNADVSEV